MMGALAEFERDLIRERTNAGLAAARARGRVGGRPRKLSTDGKVALAPLFCSSRHAFRLPVQAAYGWREQSPNPGEDTCDTRKANDHVRSEVLEKKSAHQYSKWSRSSCQGMTCPKNLSAHG